MMVTNNGGYYPSPFSNVPQGFNVGPSQISSQYNPRYQERQQKTQMEQLQTRSTVQQNDPPVPSFKLYDLERNGPSEMIRLIFSYAGAFYKEKRFKQQEWEKIKGQMSFEQLPILRVNRQFKIFHLHAIIRYLGREFRLYGVNQHDNAIVDTVLEIIRPLQDQIFERLSHPTDHEQLLKQFTDDHSTTYLNNLEKFHEIVNRHGPFYLGAQISLADLIVYGTINYLLKFDSKLLENYSHLREARRRLEKHPNISQYLRARTTPPLSRHQTKSPTPNIASPHQHQSNHHHHHRHHRHHHHRHHSKEPTPVSQTKQSTRSSKSSSISRKYKEPSAVIPPAEQATEHPVH